MVLGGIAVYVETATDNNNRTVANVRSHFNGRRRSWGQLVPNLCSTDVFFQHRTGEQIRTS